MQKRKGKGKKKANLIFFVGLPPSKCFCAIYQANDIKQKHLLGGNPTKKIRFAFFLPFLFLFCILLSGRDNFGFLCCFCLFY
jgi:hypothetical protein